MPQSRNKAVVAGLALTLTFGAVAVPALADTPSAPADGGPVLPGPSDFDRTDEYSTGSVAPVESPEAVALTRSVIGLSSEMKYFSKYESSGNYDQGFSYGDGYNAMGYYQFDRRYALVPFIESVYERDPQKYSMFAEVLRRGDELKTGVIYDKATGRLTQIGQLTEDAWHAAYAKDPAEFSALQDAYSYNNYYLPIEASLLRDHGVDISGRADCIKGLVWGMCNLFGQGGVQKFFRAANLSDGMTDREMATALCDSVIDYFTDGAGSGHKYAASYANRYRNEKADCLGFISQHEAEAGDGDLGGGDQGGSDSDSSGSGEGSDSTDPDTSNPDTSNPDTSDPDVSNPDPDGDGAEGGEIEGGDDGQDLPDAPGDGSLEGDQDGGGHDKPVDGSGDTGGAPEAGGGSTDSGNGGSTGGSGAPEEDVAVTHRITFDDCDPSTPNIVVEVEAGEAFSPTNAQPAAPPSAGHLVAGWRRYDGAPREYGA
ncbi:MAG: hypothetical protein SOU51_04125, partial [Collinsella sp.]|nr:hypothetical protein [Collinsella sp.]